MTGEESQVGVVIPTEFGATAIQRHVSTRPWRRSNSPIGPGSTRLSRPHYSRDADTAMDTLRHFGPTSSRTYDNRLMSCLCTVAEPPHLRTRPPQPNGNATRRPWTGEFQVIQKRKTTIKYYHSKYTNGLVRLRLLQSLTSPLITYLVSCPSRLEQITDSHMVNLCSSKS